MNPRRLRAIVLLFLCWLLVACSGTDPTAQPEASADAAALPATEEVAQAATPEPTETATAERPTATATPTPAPTDTPTPQPTDTPEPSTTPTDTPEPTLAPEPQVRVVMSSANIRSGPGTAYEVVGTATEGQELEVLAATGDKSWYVVALPGGEHGWLAASVCEAVDAAALADVQPAETIPAPPPTQVAAPPTTSAPSPAQGAGTILIINELSEWIVDVWLWDCCDRYAYKVDPGTSYVIELPLADYGFGIAVGGCMRHLPNVNLSEESPTVRIIPDENNRCGAYLALSGFDEY